MPVGILLCNLIFDYVSLYFIMPVDISLCQLRFHYAVSYYVCLVIQFMTLSNTFLVHRRKLIFLCGSTPANFAKNPRNDEILSRICTQIEENLQERLFVRNRIRCCLLNILHQLEARGEESECQESVLFRLEWLFTVVSRYYQCGFVDCQSYRSSYRSFD
jgi:hypothetical protein